METESESRLLTPAFTAHTPLSSTPQTGLSRIVVNQDFTGEGRTDDPYGHGTHVAAAAAGNGIVAKGEYIGIAPRAKILNLRVLNSKGTGIGVKRSRRFQLADDQRFHVQRARSESQPRHAGNQLLQVRSAVRCSTRSRRPWNRCRSRGR